MLPELERRRIATQFTLDRYRPKVFDWSRGVTCIHLAWCQLRQMGHKPPTLPRFRSALAAKRSLKERGFETVEAALDSLLPRIPPAMMLLGDLASVPGDAGLDALFVCAGPQKLMGWREDAETMVVLDISLAEVSGAWRV